MPGLDAARLRALADELDAEEAAAQRELEDAESKTEREKLEATIAELQTKQAELEERLKRGDPPPPAVGEEEEPEAETKPRTRKGRKNGQVYQDKPGESAYVYQGEDEPDIVVIEEDEAAA